MSECEIDRCEFWILANRRVRLSGRINAVGERIQVNSHYNFNYLESELADYEGRDILEFFALVGLLMQKTQRQMSLSPRIRRERRIMLSF